MALAVELHDAIFRRFGTKSKHDEFEFDSGPAKIVERPPAAMGEVAAASGGEIDPSGLDPRAAFFHFLGKPLPLPEDEMPENIVHGARRTEALHARLKRVKKEIPVAIAATTSMVAAEADRKARGLSTTEAIGELNEALVAEFEETRLGMQKFVAYNNALHRVRCGTGRRLFDPYTPEEMVPIQALRHGVTAAEKHAGGGPVLRFNEGGGARDAAWSFLADRTADVEQRLEDLSRHVGESVAESSMIEEASRMHRRVSLLDPAWLAERAAWIALLAARMMDPDEDDERRRIAGKRVDEEIMAPLWEDFADWDHAAREAITSALLEDQEWRPAADALRRLRASEVQAHQLQQKLQVQDETTKAVLETLGTHKEKMTAITEKLRSKQASATVV